MINLLAIIILALNALRILLLTWICICCNRELFRRRWRVCCARGFRSTVFTVATAIYAIFLPIHAFYILWASTFVWNPDSSNYPGNWFLCNIQTTVGSVGIAVLFALSATHLLDLIYTENGKTKALRNATLIAFFMIVPFVAVLLTRALQFQSDDSWEYTSLGIPKFLSDKNVAIHLSYCTRKSDDNTSETHWLFSIMYFIELILTFMLTFYFVHDRFDGNESKSVNTEIKNHHSHCTDNRNFLDKVSIILSHVTTAICFVLFGFFLFTRSISYISILVATGTQFMFLLSALTIAFLDSFENPPKTKPIQNEMRIVTEEIVFLPF